MNGMSTDCLVLFFVSRMYSNPGLFATGPCGSTSKLRHVFNPVWDLVRSIPPNSSGVISPTANDRVRVAILMRDLLSDPGLNYCTDLIAARWGQTCRLS